MSIVVENGTGLASADSYLSVADADTYHSDRANTSWTGTDEVKEIALRKATQYLDSTYNWIGKIYSTTQSLSWPRVGVLDRQGRDLEGSVPQPIKNAIAELAMISLTLDLVSNTTSDDYIKREKVGPLETEYKDGAPAQTEYNFVARILSGLYTSKTTGSSIGLTRA